MTDDKILIDIKSLKKSLRTAIQFPNKKNYTIHYLNVEEVNLILYLIEQEQQRTQARINARKSAEFHKKALERKKLKACENCKYCRPSNEPIHRGCYVCLHKGSPYYGSFLNIDLEGNILPFIIGEGCSKWVNKRG